MFDRFLGPAVTVSSLVLAGLSVGCDGSAAGSPSPSSPSPQPVPSGPVVTSVSPSVGPPNESEEIRVGGRGFVLGASVMLDGIAARIIDITHTAIIATTPVREPGTVDVVVTNPNGASDRLLDGYTFGVFGLTAGPSVVISGDQLTVNWTASSGRPTLGGGDWISIFRVSDPDSNHGWFQHLDGASAGTLSLKAPTVPGQYEFRYMIGETAATRSNSVTVKASASP